jgi:hypothetical protein
MWKNTAELVSDPKFTTIDVKRLGPAAAREIGTFSLKAKAPTLAAFDSALISPSAGQESRSTAEAETVACYTLAKSE